jgi:hypothetical protein
MFEAAGEFSVAAIEIGGWLLKATESATKQAHDEADKNSVGLTVAFDGPGEEKGRAITKALTRPKRSTPPDALSAAPLESRSGKGNPISGVRFAADLAIEGMLVAAVTIPADQEPGVYSHLVYAKSEDVPLGVLTIEVVK